MTQTARLEAILKDGSPHRTDDLVRQVYGDRVALGRLAARVWDVKRKLPPGWTLRSWNDKGNPGLHWYQVMPPASPQGEIFARRAQ